MASLRHALLAHLTHGAATGYALSKAMRRPVGAMWQASHSQVYPELNRLEADGLITHVSARGRGPRPTKSYELTAAGWAELERWLAGPTPPREEKDAFALKVYAGAAADRATLRRMVIDERDLHAEILARYEALPLFQHPPAPGTPLCHRWTALMLGVSYERHRIHWCDWYLTELERWDEAPG